MGAGAGPLGEGAGPALEQEAGPEGLLEVAVVSFFSPVWQVGTQSSVLGAVVVPFGTGGSPRAQGLL